MEEVETTASKKIIGVPKGLSRIFNGLIPHDWAQDRLDNFATVVYGISAPLDRARTEGVRLLAMPNVNVDGEFLLDDVPFVDAALVKERNILEQGDLLFNWRNGSEKHIGKTAYYNLEGVHTHVGFLLRVRTDHNLNSFYLGLYINYIRRKGYFTKSKVQVNNSFNKEELSELPIFFPKRKEQDAIAEILSTWDDAITTTQALIAQLQLRKKGLMQQLLTGKTRLKGFAGEWKVNKLGAYFSERGEFGFDHLKLLSVGRHGVYPQDQDERKDTSNSNKSKYKRICPGDIGYNTMRLWQGRSSLSKIEGIVSPAYTILVPNEQANSIFFSYLFQLDEMIHKFYRNSQGMVSDTWLCKYKDFAMVKFYAPHSKKEQDAIATILQIADQEIGSLQERLAVHQAQKRGLMQQLLTGQKRVTVN